MLEFAKLKAYETVGELPKRKNTKNAHRQQQQEQNKGIGACLSVRNLYIGNEALKKYIYIQLVCFYVDVLFTAI